MYATVALWAVNCRRAGYTMALETWLDALRTGYAPSWAPLKAGEAK